nr:hypothetical protein [Phormidium sp. CCY1219]
MGTGHEIGMNVALDDVSNSHLTRSRHLQINIHIPTRIDNRYRTGFVISHHVR